jgi:ribonuclease HI
MIVSFTDKERLALANEKTKGIVLTRSGKTINHRQAKLKIFVGEFLIKFARDPLEYLGLLFDSKLHFGPHIDRLVKRMGARITVLKAIASSTYGADRLTLRTLALTWLEPVGRYAENVWSIASQSQLNKLDAISRASSRIITGTTNRTRNIPLLIATESEPLGQKRFRQKVKLGLRLNSGSLAAPLVSHWQNWKLSAETNPIIRKRITILPLDNSELRAKFGSGSAWHSPFWHYYQALANVNFSPNEKVESSPHRCDPLEDPPPPYPTCEWPVLKSSSEKLTYATSSCNNNWDNLGIGGYMIFTDGSSSACKLGFGGAGWVLFKKRNQDPPNWNIPSAQSSQAIGTLCDNFCAEIVAIVGAVTYLIASPGHDPLTPIEIWSDCQSALVFCRNHAFSHFGDYRSVLAALHLSLCSLPDPLVVTFHWVPAHCDFPANDAADSFAKKGMLRSKKNFLEGIVSNNPLNIPKPIKVLLAYALTRIKEQAQSWWDKDTQHSHLYAFHPKLSYKPSPFWKQFRTRRLQVVVDRIRLGACVTNAGLFKWNFALLDSCSMCDLSPDSVVHRIEFCPGYNNEREVLNYNKNGGDDSPLSLLSLLNWQLKPEKVLLNLHALLRFLSSSNLKNVFVWTPKGNPNST